jgi:starch phosphorylase
MEYGLDASMKSYAGGLGILAGDYLKGAKQYDYPIIGIGIKWKQGYTDQFINKDNKVYDSYVNQELNFLKDTGIKVTVKIRQKDVVCKVWLADAFDNAPIYLLDTDIEENEDKWITGQLYGWFEEERIAQEIVLGIGGIKALRALGIEIDVYHFNEGHALFAGFELIKEKMTDGISFEESVLECKKQIVFTTHTPIVEGNESHEISKLMYMGANNGLTEQELESLGGAPFNMTVGALRLCKIANGVAKLHEITANKMWSHLGNISSIIGITNAIHIPTWVDEKMLQYVQSSKDLWNRHMENKQDLIDFVYERNNIKLSKDKLLIGFSRRAAPYKRSDLIFTDERVISKLFDEGLVQIIFSGKAHPLDDNGKKIIENIINISKKYPSSVVFLENYDMTIGKALTRGCDVWLNNPRRPLEASGTSGMKAAMNGVLNCSILDGWWAEACLDNINGWQFGDGKEVSDFKSLDELDNYDLKQLYKVLLGKVIPTYYDNKSIWVEMIRQSILGTRDYFCVKRMLNEYYTKMYLK